MHRDLKGRRDVRVGGGLVEKKKAIGVSGKSMKEDILKFRAGGS